MDILVYKELRWNVDICFYFCIVHLRLQLHCIASQAHA